MCKTDERRHCGVLYLSVLLSIKLVVIALHNIDFVFDIVFGNFGVSQLLHCASWKQFITHQRLHSYIVIV